MCTTNIMDTGFDEDDSLQRLRHLVLVKDKIVTFNFLASHHGMCAQSAQSLISKLKDQLKEEGRGDDVILSFMICGSKGIMEDSETEDDFVKIWKIIEVDEDEVEETEKAFFTQVSGRTVKSIRPKDLPQRLKAEKHCIARPEDDWKDTQEGDDFKETIVDDDDKTQEYTVSQEPEALKDDKKPSKVVSAAKPKNKSVKNFFSKTNKNEIQDMNGETKKKDTTPTKNTKASRKDAECSIDESPLAKRKNTVKRRIESEDEDTKESMNHSEDDKKIKKNLRKESVKRTRKSSNASENEQLDSDLEEIPVKKRSQRRRIQRIVDSDDDSEPGMTFKMKSEDDETVIKAKKKERQEAEKTRKLAIKEEERREKLKEREAEKESKRLEKEKQLAKKMNGRVKVKEDDPGHAVELIDVDEEEVDDEGFTTIKKVKKVVKKQLTKEDKKSDPFKTSSSKSSSQNGSSQSSASKKSAPSSQKRITDFFTKK